MTFGPESPIYLDPTLVTEAAIRNRLVFNARVLRALDTSEGSWEMDALVTVSTELAYAADMPLIQAQRIYTATAAGADLDAKADEAGIDARKTAVAATGTLQFTAPPGTVIALGKRVTTGTLPQVVYATTAAATVPVGATTVAVPAVAVVVGTNGNQPIGAVTTLVDSISGATAITNITEMGGGADIETDDDLRVRIQAAHRERAASGNRAEVRELVLDIPGVGGVQASYPDEGSPPVVGSEIRLSLITPAHLPASAALVEIVRDALSEPWRQTVEAETLPLTGSGVSVATDAAAISGSAVLYAYSVTAIGTATQTRLDLYLAQSGTWELHLRIRHGASVGTGNLLRVRVLDIFAGTAALVSPLGPGFADYTLTAAMLPATYTDVYVGDFFVNRAISQYSLVIDRLQADVTTQVYLDEVFYRGAQQRQDIDHALPGGWRLRVQPAATVSIDVTITLTYVSGVDQAATRAAIRAAIVAYLAGLPFGVGTNQTVQVGAIGDAIFNTPGVSGYDFTTLRVNTAQQNITILPEQVAVSRDVIINGVAA